MTDTYTPSTATYPAWFIKALARAIEAAEALDKALGDVEDPHAVGAFYVEMIPFMYEGDTIGTLLWLDDQWQFEPDVTYWGLRDKTDD